MCWALSAKSRSDKEAEADPRRERKESNERRQERNAEARAGSPLTRACSRRNMPPGTGRDGSERRTRADAAGENHPRKASRGVGGKPPNERSNSLEKKKKTKVCGGLLWWKEARVRR